MLHRFSPNKCSKIFVAISQNSYCRKEACAIQKLFKKRRREKKELKNGQVSELLKQWVLRCPPEK
jgi:hypothetical protein